MAGKPLKGSKSVDNLKDAFAGESQANRRYLYFARVADIEGFPDVAGLFKDTADAETGHAFGHLDFLKEVGDPATGEPIGKTEKNLKAAVAGETYEYTQMYPGMAKTARDEGFAGDGRVVRDPGQGREVARRPLHQGAHPGRGQGAGRRHLVGPRFDPGRAPASRPAPGLRTAPIHTRERTMTLDIRVPEFWKLDRVDAELRRVYDICAGCRRCLPLCPSFKVMFDRLDVDAVDGDVEKLPAADVKEVVDLCYQCKLCYNHCPYTPPHRWQVDFPRLMLRARSAEARRRGDPAGPLPRQHRAGRAARQPHRARLELDERVSGATAAFMEAAVGIHRDRELPPFHRETFSRWFDAAAEPPARGRARRATGSRSSRRARSSTTIPAPARPRSRCSRRTAWT